MKTFYLFLVILSSTVTFGYANNRPLPVLKHLKPVSAQKSFRPISAFVAPGPVAYYPFNGNAADAAGSLHGTVTGATLTADRLGNANSAYYFDGVDDFIETVNVATENTTEWTVSAWIRPAMVSQLGAIVTNGYDNTINFGTGYSIHLNNGGGAVGSFITGAFDGASWYNSGKILDVPNVWYHIVMVNRGGVTQLYVNGKSTPNSSNGGGYTPVGTVRIGAQDGGRFFTGAIDEVKIFDVGLTAGEVLAEYESSKPVAIEMAGSGKALKFDGTDDYVELGASFTAQNFTIDMWIKPGSTQNTHANIIDNNHTDSRNWVCQQDGDQLNTYGFGVQGANVGFNLTAEKWQHLALVKGETFVSCYVNGVLINSVPYVGTINFESQSLKLGAWGGGGRFWNGIMDEVRIWNAALSESEIRERMCVKIKGIDPRFSDLQAYYNFDEENEEIVTDQRDDHNGATIGTPVFETSGAAIGNASAFTYGGTSVSVAHEQGESLTISNIVGSPTGMQVYVVNAAPNSTSGIDGVGNNNRYFGVFHFGGTGVAYIASYDYEASPYVNSSNEDGLTLYKRDNNEDQTWEIAGLPIIGDPNSKVISVFSFDSEYMLGSTSAPLPVRLVSFDAKQIENRRVEISWTTTEEQNASHFVVERSVDAKVFSSIGKVDAVGNTNQSSRYLLTDESPFDVDGSMDNVYYRLKQVDIDGKQTVYRTVAVSFNEEISQFVYPNPVSDRKFQLNFTGSIPDITLTDINGKEIDIEANQSSFQRLTIKAKTPLKPGLYILQTKGKKENKVLKLVVN